MHTGCCEIFEKRKNTRAAARVFLRFSKISQHPACMDHAILHGKPFSNPLFHYVNMKADQFLRDFRLVYKVKKTAELQKKVQQRKEKQQEKADSVRFLVRYLVSIEKYVTN